MLNKTGMVRVFSSRITDKWNWAITSSLFVNENLIHIEWDKSFCIELISCLMENQHYHHIHKV
jgi:hypothetical protein